MPLLFERVSSRQSTGSVKSRSSLSNEEPLTGTQKVSYRPGEDWDYDAFTETAPIDVTLAMPPHRPRHQPEHHRTSMLLSSESGQIRAKVARHCLNRPFNLQVVAGTSDVTLWIPSNFKGFLSYVAGDKGRKPASLSPAFVDCVLPHACVNRPVPKSWAGDRVAVQTTGAVTLRVWDVFAKAPEKTDVWRKVFFGGGSSGGGGGGGGIVRGDNVNRRASTQSQKDQGLNWDFLIEDDDDEDD